VSDRAKPLVLQGERVRIRFWQSRDDIRQRSWPRYTDPLNGLWNIPRSFSLYGGLFPAPAPIPGNPRRLWAVENLAGELVGRISLREIDQRVMQARLGISLGAPFVGQGLGSEALELFVDYFFGTLHFRKMVLDVAAFNRRAVRCYERLGFRVVQEEWRKTSADTWQQELERTANTDLQPFFRRDRLGSRVLFFEMELDYQTWLERESRSLSDSASLSADMHEL
jgi:RimJ/RimL family protein N-acetyltransferase